MIMIMKMIMKMRKRYFIGMSGGNASNRNI